MEDHPETVRHRPNATLDLIHHLPRTLVFAGIMPASETEPGTAPHLAPSRESPRPVVSGDERYWPTPKSPLLYYRSIYRPPLPGRYRGSSECTPRSHADRKNQQADLTLQAVNNTSVPTYGTRSLTLNLRLCCTFRCVFVIANIATPILGADCLRHYNLLVNMTHNRLSDALDSPRKCVSGAITQPYITSQESQDHIRSNPLRVPGFTQPCSTEKPVKHYVTHHHRTSVTART